MTTNVVLPRWTTHDLIAPHGANADQAAFYIERSQSATRRVGGVVPRHLFHSSGGQFCTDCPQPLLHAAY
jgi:hypothetical protein